MKSSILLSLIAVTMALQGCSAKPMPQTPSHLLSGSKEIKRGTFWYNRGCYPRALNYFSRAHERFTASDQIDGVAMSLNNMGSAYKALGDIDAALLYFEESFRIYSDIHSHRGALQALSNKAAALIERGEMEQAEEAIGQAEKIAGSSQISFIPLDCNKANLLIRREKYAEAHRILSGVSVKTDPENLLESALVNTAFGKLLVAEKAYPEAMEHFKKALAADQKRGFQEGIAGGLSAIGEAYRLQGDPKLAADFLSRSVKVFAYLGNRNKVETLLVSLEAASKEAGADTALTAHFAKSWLEGAVVEGPCD